MFEGWGDFYLLIGTAAVTLIGLLFVVVTLAAGHEQRLVSRGARFYMTPIVIQFGLVLLLSGVALAPKLTAPTLGTVVAVVAMAGLLYATAIAINLPDWTDVWGYGALPVAGYLALAAAAATFWVVPRDAPYALAAVLLAQLLVSIRNAWDLVIWLAPRRPAAEGGGSPKAPS
jgi:hypothetical protein